jgi:hypothetical protein
VKVSVLGLCVLASVGIASTASAQDEMLRGRRKFESPQHFAIEFRFAPYWPNIDSEFNGAAHPYHDTFGDRPWARLLAAFEFDWQALRIPHIGTIGPGIGIGYTSMSAPALKLDGTCCSPANTNLEIFPFYGVAVLRVDAFMRDLNIPVVPYVKAGMGVGIWRTWDDGSGTSTSADGKKGNGASAGPHLAAGVALQLNVFDPGAARQLDEATGINNTYLYFEGMYSGLGAIGNGLRVGTTTWVVGLAMEF